MGKKIMVYIINFFLVVAITGMISLLIFSNTILDKKYMIDTLNKNNYYEKTDFDIKDTFKNYILQSGLDESILDGLYDKEKLYGDINLVIDGIYENKDVKIDTEGIRGILNDRINDTLKENNRVPDKNEKESIQIFVDTIVEVYEDGVIISQSTVNKINDVLAKVVSLVKKAQIALVAVIVILVIIIIAINRNIQQSIRAFGAAILSSGIIFVALKILIGKRLHYILIINNTFSDTLINTTESIISIFLNTGIVMTIIGVVGIIIGSLSKKEKVQKGRH